MFKLPKLNYSYDSLEPYIDAKTMEIHYTKHHQTYIDKLNLAFENHKNFYEKNIYEIIKNLNEVPKDVYQAVKNNGGGHLNHSIFWDILSPNSGGEPKGTLKSQLDKTFVSFTSFKNEFKNTALNRFGSGWVWLVLDSKKNLEIISTPNQDNPITDGKIPIFGLDVWEHAYYLKYQNKRNVYIDNFWNVVNWIKIDEHYQSIFKQV